MTHLNYFATEIYKGKKHYWIQVDNRRFEVSKKRFEAAVFGIVNDGLSAEYKYFKTETGFEYYLKSTLPNHLKF